MKKYLLLKLFVLILFDLSFFASKAQTPQATSYQAIIRNSSGILVSNRLVSLRFSIRDSIASGQIVYREIHNPITTTQGMVNLNIGNGTPITGTFSAINWGSNRKFLQVELDVNGGTAFTDLGTQQFLSVPYALYANKASKADTALYTANSIPTGNTGGDMLYWNGSSWVNLPAGGYGQLLAMCDGVPSWGGCPPKINTRQAISVSYTSATLGGVIYTYGQTVTSYGVCWNTSANPDTSLYTKTRIYGNVYDDGTGFGFQNYISDLNPNTTYYVRAYAINNIGISYGSQVTFTTKAITLPIVSTSAITNLTDNSASCGGDVAEDGGLFVFSRGVCWSTSPNPTVDLPTKTINLNGIGLFASEITGLTPNIRYYLRAYATNSLGNAYGSEVTFTTTNCLALNANISALAGDFNNTNEDFGGTPYGPYATSVSSYTNTTSTSGTITVENIYDFGWAPITFKLDWSNPNNPIVTLDQQEGLAGGSTVGLDDTYHVMVRAFPGENGTYSVCNQTLQLKMQIGVKDANGAELWAPSLYIVNMAR